MTFHSSLRSSKLFTYLILVLLVGMATLLLSAVLGGDRLYWQPEALPQAGGNTTINNRSSRAFGKPAPGLTAQQMDLHTAGDVAFDDIFVTAPAKINPGLGPLFNNSSCSGCHVGNGRGLPQLGQALVRVSLPIGPGQAVAAQASKGIASEIGVVPVPQIGTQLRDRAVYGQAPDAKIELSWREGSGQYPDGQSYQLRSPQLLIHQADSNKPIPDTLLTSLRVPPPVFGDGLLEAIPEKVLAQLADPTDQNHDGISGRINRVWNPETQTFTVGRFGLKASSPNLRHQTASAYVHDMGISNPLFPGESGSSNSKINSQITEIDDRTLKATTFYTQSLGVPARTQMDDPKVQTGEKLFVEANCAACHLTTLKTGASPIQALAHQTIHPYTDLLLHDLGLGLADHRPDFEATGQEWRTSPLWGLGLAQTVLPSSGYLHDGRARSIEEAILWHGGEAEASKARFMAMEVGDRQALLSFLNSL